MSNNNPEDPSISTNESGSLSPSSIVTRPISPSLSPGGDLPSPDHAAIPRPVSPSLSLGDNDNEDMYEATADELEEEAQDTAVRKIQSIYRARRARNLMKQLIKANYVKEYDEETGYFFYRNKR